MTDSAERISIPLWMIGIGVIVLIAIVSQSNVDTPIESPAAQAANDSPSATDSYFDRYGGQQSVYALILGTRDCQALQAQFDTAADNNDRAAAGSDESRWTLGYMTAADDQLDSAGCYN